MTRAPSERRASAGPEPGATRSATTAPGPSPEALTIWIRQRRWYRAPERDDAGGLEPPQDRDGLVTVSELPLPIDPPSWVGIVDTPDHDRYQLLLPAEAGDDRPDLADDPATATGLLGWMADPGRVPTQASTSGATVTATWLPGSTAVGRVPARPLGGEQSNTSMIVGGTHVLKVFRRLQAGPHPEIDIGRHLAAVADAGTPSPVARLCGWYELVPPGAEPEQATALGVVQDLVPGALDAWGLVLSALAGDPGGFLPRLSDLGSALASLHGALARPAAFPDAQPQADATGPIDPEAPEAFGVTALDHERIDAMVAAVGADAQRLFATTFDRPDAIGSLAGRADEVTALATSFAEDLGTDLGAAIRHHGDLHLGQVVLGDHGWIVLDFEGEPARPLAERRRRHSPLRDVAGMVRSFAYAAGTHRRSGSGDLSPGWEPAARAAFLDGYLAHVDPTLLPASAATTQRLLRLFELEKVLYEIGYELGHRPDWVDLPIAGLHHLLDGSTS